MNSPLWNTLDGDITLWSVNFGSFLAYLVFSVYCTSGLTKRGVVFQLVFRDLCLSYFHWAFGCVGSMLSLTIRASRVGCAFTFVALPTSTAQLRGRCACSCNAAKLVAFLTLQGSCSVGKYLSSDKTHFDMLGCHLSCEGSPYDGRFLPESLHFCNADRGL